MPRKEGLGGNEFAPGARVWVKDFPNDWQPAVVKERMVFDSDSKNDEPFYRVRRTRNSIPRKYRVGIYSGVVKRGKGSERPGQPLDANQILGTVFAGALNRVFGPDNS
ncbi:MAG: hypothetical protein V4449_03550 [Patescibacteria group bacterium]